jgi:hypothetical protein
MRPRFGGSLPFTFMVVEVEDVAIGSPGRASSDRDRSPPWIASHSVVAADLHPHPNRVETGGRLEDARQARHQEAGGPIEGAAR